MQSRIIRGFLVVLIAVAAIVVVQHTGLPSGIDDMKAWMDARVVGRGFSGVGLFLAACSLFTAIGFSRQVFAYVAGYAFGAAYGTGLTLVAEMIGVVLAFSYARFFARDLVMKRYGRRLRRINEVLEASPFQMTLIVRLNPVGNNLFVNLAAGVSRIRFAPFMYGSAIGHFPQTLVFALLGDGLAEGGIKQGVLATALFAVSSLLALHVWRKRHAIRQLDTSKAD